MVSHNYFNTKRNKIKITFSSADPVNLHRNEVLEYSLASFSISNNSSKTYFNPNTSPAWQALKGKRKGIRVFAFLFFACLPILLRFPVPFRKSTTQAKTHAWKSRSSRWQDDVSSHQSYIIISQDVSSA